MGTTPILAGTIGAAAISVRSLPAQKPQMVMAAKDVAIARVRLRPHRATPIATPIAKAAAMTQGQSAGSVFRPR